MDFSIKLLGKAHEIHKSAQGTLQENLDIVVVGEAIRTLQAKLRIQDADASDGGKPVGSLEQLCSNCDETAKVLLDVLGKLKVR